MLQPTQEMIDGLRILKDNGRQRIADEIEKQITLTLMKGGMLYHLQQQIKDEIALLLGDHDE